MTRFMEIALTAVVCLGLLAPDAKAQNANSQKQKKTPPAAEVQVTSEATPDGGYVLTLDSPAATLQKTVYPGRVELQVSSPGHDTLAVVVTDSGIQVSAGERRAHIDRKARPADLHSARGIVGGHPALPMARAVARYAAAGDPRVAHAARLTETLLAILSGDSAAAGALVAERAEPRLLRAQRTSQECWEQYRRDAILIRTEYEICFRGTRWYEVDVRFGCAAEFILRAEMAFSWLVACNGGFMGH